MSKSKVPYLTVLVLAVCLLVLAVFLRPGRPDRPGLRIRVGSASELATPIRQAPRAIVYIDAPRSDSAAASRQHFLEAARRLWNDHAPLGLQFFLVEDNAALDSDEWLKSLGDDGVGLLGSGGLIWLEHGQVRQVGQLPPNEEMVGGTLALWGVRP